jgi:site-specific recombinase XerD
LYKDIYTNKGLVFASETGDYLSHRKALAEVKKVYKMAGISTTHTFHDLRHTFCSILIYKNVYVKTISRLMGHSSITITLDTYATIFKEMEAKTMDELDDILDLNI